MFEVFIVGVIYVTMFIIYTVAVGFSNFRSEGRFWKVVLDWALIIFLAVAIFLISLSGAYAVLIMTM